jgi:hypothetical protein
MQSIVMKAQKPYSLVDIIIRCEPLVNVLFIEYKGFRCDYCLDLRNHLKKCSKCKQMFDCNQKCRKNDSIFGHKYECDLFKRFGHQIKALETERLSRSSHESKPYERLLIYFISYDN